MTDNLEGLRAALRRGTNRSRLRLLVVVCPKDHKLIEVFRGDDGTPTAIYWTADLYVKGRGLRPHVGPVAHASATHCRCRNDAPSDLVWPRRPPTAVTLWKVPSAVLYAAIQAGVGRVVADPSWRAVEDIARSAPVSVYEAYLKDTGRVAPE